MKRLHFQTRTLAIMAVLLPLLALFVYVALRSGPLAPVTVTVSNVEELSIAPGLFGIGTVASRYTYKIGPTFAGRLTRLDVQVGDQVQAGQLLGEMDPVDLDERIHSQEAAVKRAEAQLRDARSRQAYAQTQARRFEQLLAVRSTSEEIVTTKKHELQVADAGLDAAREELARTRSERAALLAQRNNLRLVATADGLVAVRDADPGTTVVAGQAVVELIDPKNLWLNVRFDQLGGQGLAAGLPVQIVLRSRAGQTLAGHILRVEPLADEVTEETLAKVVFDQRLEPLPPVGELAEVTVTLPALPETPVIPNAAIQRSNGQTGVWQVKNGDLHFTPVTLGTADLEGNVQVRTGLAAGDRVVVYSAKALSTRSRIKVVDRIPGVRR
ncbi:MAG: efflux RND transporter periplasmic adaptor subunit [Deltaproteobacteria bacterium]|nr:efflux RND transporter periplasmic adaptor subunit [Deltaproteobacteria bacterium]TLN05227.1 MAG: efflux RND transporter periplasmic adaptor subunit [bacterium]